MPELDTITDESKEAVLPPWEHVADQYQQQFPALDPAKMQEQYEQHRQGAIKQAVQDFHMSRARERLAGQEETTRSYLSRNILPFGSSLVNFRQSQEYSAAKKRLDAGEPRDADYQTIAGYERVQQLDQERNKTFLGKLQGAAVSAPAMLGEFAVGGGVMKAAGAVAKAGVKVSVPVWTGRLATQTAMVPSLYMKQYTDANLERGRDPLDLNGLPPAFGAAMVQNAILGNLSSLGAFQGAGVGNFAGRQAMKGVTGAGEQILAADPGTGLIQDAVRKVLPEWTKKESHYGVLGDFANGKYGEGAQNAFVQALTFAVFGGMHEGMHGTPEQLRKAGLKQLDEQAREQGRKAGVAEGRAEEFGKQAAKDASQPLVDYYRDVGRSGKSMDAANAGLEIVNGRVAEVLKGNPDASRAEVSKALEGMPDNTPIAKYARWVASNFPNVQGPPAPPPQTPPGGMPAPPAGRLPPPAGGGVPGGFPNPPGTPPTPPGAQQGPTSPPPPAAPSGAAPAPGEGPTPLGPPGQGGPTPLGPPKRGEPPAFTTTSPEVVAPKAGAKPPEAPTEVSPIERLLPKIRERLAGKEAETPEEIASVAADVIAREHKLSAQDKKILKARLAGESLLSIGKRLGLSDEGVRGVEKKILEKIGGERSIAEARTMLEGMGGEPIKASEETGGLGLGRHPQEEALSPGDQAHEEVLRLLEAGKKVPKSLLKKVQDFLENQSGQGDAFWPLTMAKMGWNKLTGKKVREAVEELPEGEKYKGLLEEPKIAAYVAKRYKAGAKPMTEEEWEGLRQFAQYAKQDPTMLDWFKEKDFVIPRWSVPSKPLSAKERVARQDRPQPDTARLEELKVRHEAGEPVSLDEVFDAANLDRRERHVVEQRLKDRSLGDIGKDPEMQFAEGEFRSRPGEARERGSVKYQEEHAMARLGTFASIAKAVHAAQKIDGMIKVAAQGKLVKPEELHNVDRDEGNKRVQAQFDIGTAIDNEMTALSKQFLREERRGELTPERESFFESEFNRLSRATEPGPEQADWFERRRQETQGAAAKADRGGPGKVASATGTTEGVPGTVEKAPFGSGKKPMTERTAMDAAKDFLSGESGAVNLDVLKDKAREYYDRLKSAVGHVRDNIAELAGRMGPRTTALNRRTGEVLAELNGVKVFAHEQAIDKINNVLENASKTDREYLGNGINEMHLRHTRDAWGRKAVEENAAQAKALQTEQAETAKAATATTPQEKKIAQAEAARARKEAVEHAERAKEAQDAQKGVKTALGPDEPIKDEAGYQAFLKDPRVQPLIKRWQDHMVETMDKNYKEATGMEDTDDINSFTQIPGFPVNLLPRKGEKKPDTGPGQGNLKGTYQGKLWFANERKGNAPNGYENDLGKMIENSISHGAQRAAKARLFRTANENGVGKWGSPGQQVEIDGEKTKEIPHVFPPKGTQENEAGQSSFYVKEPAYQEFRNALKVDQPTHLETLQGINKVMTLSSLSSTVEAVYHGKNLLTMMFKPGMSPAKFFSNLVGVIRGDPTLRAELVEIARIGALKGEGMESGLILPHEHAHLDPTYYMGKSLDVLQRAMRLTANQAFDTLVSRFKGEVPDTQTNRRDFINQLGQYQNAAQNKFVRLMRDTGFGPFAVAGTNYWIQGQRAMTLGHGLQTGPEGKGSLQAEIWLRANMAARIAGMAGAALAANYLMWGRVDGDDKVPLGALKLGTKDGKSTYFDLTNLTGLTRGMRQTGALALLEGERREEGAGKVLDRATDNILHGLLHPATGPMVSFAHTAWTGENTLGQKVAEKAPLGGSQRVQNIESAVKNMNPTLATIKGWDRPNEKDSTLWDRSARLAGPFGLKSTSAQEPVVRNYYDRLKDLEDHRRDSPERKKGLMYPNEVEYRRLHAFKEKMDQIAMLLRGEAKSGTQVVTLPQPLPEEQKTRLRAIQTELAKRALGK